MISIILINYNFYIYLLVEYKNCYSKFLSSFCILCKSLIESFFSILISSSIPPF